MLSVARAPPPVAKRRTLSNEDLQLPHASN